MYTEQELLNCQAGFYGVEAITDTNAHTGPFGRIEPLATTVIASLKAELLTGGTLDGESLAVGQNINLPGITSITLTSGKLLAYRLPMKGI